MTTRKSPLAALMLSLVVPGLGQVYAKEVAKGALIGGVCLVLGGGTWWLTGLNRITFGLALIIVWMSAALDAYKTVQACDQPQDWYFRRSYVITMLLLVGPLALPLLWRNPSFSPRARRTWTLVVMSGALFLLTTPYLLWWVVRRVPGFANALQQSGLQP